jgi:ribonuclease Y
MTTWVAAEAARLRAAAEAERQAIVRDAEIAAREEALTLRAAAESELRQREEAQAAQASALAARGLALDARAKANAEARARVQERGRPAADHEADAARQLEMARADAARARGELERRAGETAAVLRQALADAEVEQARAQAAQLVRQVGDAAALGEQTRAAKRIMGISVGRFAGHYLTERHQSIVPLGDGRHEPRAIPEEDLRAIEGVAGIKLSMMDTRDAVRIEGMDGVGREVARRSLTQVVRRPGTTGEAVTRLTREVAAEMDREILGLGRKAFATLEIPRAHPEIVRLVGRLNFRTSYTQNQWKHAVEAAFLCGMMADELLLDRKVARRAALMHDIGKALTHELDGSHAVIGADYARRLGEPEVVANAIGAHHTDEPFASAYAYLVAAADAMSGARPGARRQTEVDHVAKLADLERLTRSFAGVEEAFAVQGGREVRVYVREDEIDDLGAVTLSSRIAETISREMTFPGQIKVTVIREFRAIETAS